VTLAFVTGFFDWLTTTPWAKAMIAAEWVFPAVQSLHFIGFALSIGTIAIVDLRLMRLGMRSQSPAELIRVTAPWTLIGIALVTLSGALLVTTDPLSYWYNAAFRWKMASLLTAIIYNYTVHLKVASSEASAVIGMLAGGISIALWISVVFGGIFYAFI